MKTETRSEETGELTGVYYTFCGSPIYGVEQLRLRAGRRGAATEWGDYNPSGLQNITDIKKRWKRRRELRARNLMKTEPFTLDDL